jgi:hypothetical protein
MREGRLAWWCQTRCTGPVHLGRVSGDCHVYVVAFRAGPAAKERRR